MEHNFSYSGNTWPTLVENLEIILSIKVQSFKYEINAGCKNIRITVLTSNYLILRK